MSTKFSKSDRTFLTSVGISVEPTFDDTRLALAERIAKHSPPAQLKIDPEEAKRQLINFSLKMLLDAEREQP